MRKRGPPARGEARRLTNAEASVVGCSERWWVSVSSDGRVTLHLPGISPWTRVSPSGEVAVTWSHPAKVPPATAERIARQLHAYWGRQRVSRTFEFTDIQRIAEAARSALRGRVDRAEMEWMAGLDQ